MSQQFVVSKKLTGKKRKKTVPMNAGPRTKIPRSLGNAPLASRGFGDMGFVANREKKFYDVGFQNSGVSTTGTFHLLFCPTLGSDYSNRIGRKAIIKSLYTKAFFNVEQALTNTNGFTPCQMMRMIIFVDYQPNGVTPVTLDLLQNNSPIAHLNPNNRDRFKIIKDKTFTFDPVLCDPDKNRVAFNRTCADIKNYKKLHIETIFNSTNAGTIGDITTGALYLFLLGSQPLGANDIDAGVYTRVRFDDV